MPKIYDDEYHDDGEYPGLSPFAEDEQELQLQEPEVLPAEVENKVYQLAAIAVAQLIPNPQPATTYAAGVGPGMLRQNIVGQLERYWREHRCLPSGRYEIEGRKAVQLPAIED